MYKRQALETINDYRAQNRASLIAAGQMTDLGTFGGPNSAPYGMDAQGDVVGAAETTAGVRHAFLAPAGGALIDLSLIHI